EPPQVPERRAHRREGDLARRRGEGKPPYFRDVVPRADPSPPRRRPVDEREHGLAARPVLVGVRAEVPRPAEPEPELLAELAAERLLRRLALFEEAAGQVPRAGPRRPARREKSTRSPRTSAATAAGAGLP